MFVGGRKGTVGGEGGDEGVKGDRRIRVGVSHGGEAARDGELATELLVDFTVERAGGGFAGFDFPAGEFPLERQVFAGGALRDEHAIVPLDEHAANGNRIGDGHGGE